MSEGKESVYEGRARGSVNRPAWTTGLVVALMASAALVFVGGFSVSRKIESFQPVGFETEEMPGGWLVSAVTAEGTGLTAGDQIVLVNGSTFGTVGDLGETLRRAPEAELVVLRAEELVEVAFALPPPDLDLPYLILAVIGCGYLFIGLYTLMRHRQRPSLLFHLWCLASAAVFLIAAEPPFDLPLAKIAYVAEAAARIFLAPLTLHLFTIFPRTASGSRLRRAVPFYYLPAVFLLLAQVDVIGFNGRILLGGAAGLWRAIPLLDQIELYHLLAFSLAAAGLLAWRLWRHEEREASAQATWVAIGIAAGYLPFLFVYVLPRQIGTLLPEPVTAAAVMPLALVPLTFAYAILRYKLWDIAVVVRNTASLSLTILIGVIGFSLASLAVNRLVPTDLAVAKNLLVFSSGLMIAGLLVPTRKGLSRSLERVQYRTSFGRRRALTDFGSEIVRETNLERLADRVAEELEACLGVRPANVLLLQGQALVTGRQHEGIAEFLPASEFAEEFWSADVVSLSTMDFPATGVTTEHQLFAAGFRYAFPLKVRTHNLGFVVTGYKEDEVPLSSDDVDLLRSLFNQVALALENAQLLGQVRRQLDEVSRLQRFNREIIESSPAGIAVLDGSGRVVSANDALARIAGVAPEAITGQRLRDHLPIDPLPEPGEGLRQVHVAPGDSDGDGDGDGEERYLQISVAPLGTPRSGGETVLVVQDVSERVAMENALKEKDRLASLGMLAAGVAHEVNTPITGISSYAQMLLADTEAGDPRRQLLEKVEKQTFRASRIVNSLLDFARDRGGEQRPLDLGPLVDESLDLLKELIHERRARLDWTLPATEIRVRGNGGELQQVITNLAINALDAMANGDGDDKHLSVEVSANDRWAWVAIEDNGPGIPLADLDKIFQPFYSTKLSVGGTGLGLSISYQIVKRHGGDVRVVSEPGHGCRFLVELPLAG